MATTPDHYSLHPELESPGYERKDTNVLKLTVAVLVILVTLVFSIIWLDHYFFVSKTAMLQERVHSLRNPLLVETRAKDTGVLQSYGVVDAAAGRYRVPITEAMRLIADEDYQSRRAPRP